MAHQVISQSLIIEVCKSLRSYSVAGKIAVISCGVQGLGVAMAQACMMAMIADVVLVDVDEKRLSAAKLQLELTVNELNVDARIHYYATAEGEPERIASIFFSIRSGIGFPDLLLLGSKQATLDKPILECTTGVVSYCFDLEDKTRNFFVHNFLAPGTAKRRSLITVTVVRDTNTGSQEHHNFTHFLAHAKTLDGDTWFTVRELTCDVIRAQPINGNFAAKTSLSSNLDLYGHLGVLLISEETAWLLNNTIVREEPIVGEARKGQAFRREAKVVNIGHRRR